MTVALGVVFLAIGSLLSVLDLSSAVLASLLVSFIYLELGSPYTWLVWLATALLSFIMFPGSFAWLTYLSVFGIFPIMKGYIERLPRIFWMPLKLVFFNAMFTLIVLFSEVLIGQSVFGDFTGISEHQMVIYGLYVGIWLLFNLGFILYDRMIVVLVVWYEQKLRPRLANLLK